jgi:hypothetical protein
VPEDIARESEVPSEGDGEQGQSDNGSDAPGSQNVLASFLLLRRAALRWVGIVHGSASCHRPDRRELRSRSESLSSFGQLTRRRSNQMPPAERY